MVRRRKLIAGIGGTVALAGCLDNNTLTIIVNDRNNDPVNDASVEIEEQGNFSGNDIASQGTTNNSGIFESEIGSGEFMIRASHEDIGEASEKIEINGSTEKTIQLIPDIVLIVEGEDGSTVTNANVVIKSIGVFASGDTIASGSTNRSGVYTANIDQSGDVEIRITHDNYFEEVIEVDMSSKQEHSVTLFEFDEESNARRITEDILENETDTSTGIYISGPSDGLEVDAEANFESWSGTESQYNDKAADILEQVFESDANIQFFTINLYAPTVDEYGNEDFTKALTVGMSEETANQINWSRYNSDNLSRHAETYILNTFLFS